MTDEYRPLWEDAVIDRVNTLRARDGRAPLVERAALRTVARDHTMREAKANQLAETFPGEGTLLARLAEQGYSAEGAWDRSVLSLGISKEAVLGLLNDLLAADQIAENHLIHSSSKHIGVGVLSDPDHDSAWLTIVTASPDNPALA